ncbi:MAG: DEAD/DEAH box helicase [Thermoplasmata archaeon]
MDREFIESAYKDYENQIVFSTTIPEKNAEYAESDMLHRTIKDRLEEHGISLYSHQAEAIDLFLENEDVCLTTGTASGKTLAYALSLAHLIKKKKRSKALLIFPTKALTRDQKEELEMIFSLLDMNVNFSIYDGDVSSEKKRKAREKADIILTNFTGLNLYLSHHQKWASFFEDLKAVVIDEAHHYRGLLGIHVAWIIRRLRRIVRYYDQDPGFLLCSATLGNPEEHSKNLVGKDFKVVDRDGSERGKRSLFFWNPPRLHEEIGQRKSTHRESSELMAFLMNKGFQTLMFAPSRKMTELDALWVEDILEEKFNDKRSEVEPYHAGHPKEKRRKTERKLRKGEIDGVVSTTALELGINIGDIDVTLLSGYPGSRISFWQQIGRAGREKDDVMSVLVPFNSALDQYIVNEPDHLLGEPIENAVIDLSNNQIYSSHLLSAAQELPLTKKDVEFFDDRLKQAVKMWKKEGSLTGNLKKGIRYIKDDFPQHDIDLYSAGSDTFEVQIRRKNSIETLPDIDRNRAYREFHPGAVYLHGGEYFQTVEFDEGARPKVVLEPVEIDYYTQSLKDTSISGLKIEDKRRSGEFDVYKGEADVSLNYFAYKKKKLSNDEVISTERLDLDPVELHTQTTWIEIPEKVESYLKRSAGKKAGEPGWNSIPKEDYHGGLHATEHSLIHMLPLLMMIDEKDVGGVSTNFHSEIDGPGIFIYDAVDGGVGFSHDAYDRLEELASKSVKRLKNCSCRSVKGCPSCTFSSDCGNDNSPLNRLLAIELLKRLKG